MFKIKPESWGRYPRVKHKELRRVFWRDEALRSQSGETSILPFGQGRSYGDSCLNADGILISTQDLDRWIAFDRERGILKAEAGITFQEILKVIVPAGWFLPVTPGTQQVTLGGAIANDVHGKNHHRAGCFGSHLLSFELVRSDGSAFTCSPAENEGFFKATIGGLGLTGLITWAEIQLVRIPSPWIRQRVQAFRNLGEFFDLSDKLEKAHEYTVAWMDCGPSKKTLGRGIYLSGEFTEAENQKPFQDPRPHSVPFVAPGFLLNKKSIQLFNTLYFKRNKAKRPESTVHYRPFFYPLDSVQNWNRLYGPRGFLQYQCVVPDQAALTEVFLDLSKSTALPFLSVLKKFGNHPSPGLLSFPRPGFTLALDFPFRGEATLRALDRLDSIVATAGGAVYPAKDARMSAQNFQKFYPHLEEFYGYKDPLASSSFWRRVHP